MVLIYKNKINKIFIFIHIPKNSGKFIRKKILKNNDLIKSFWNIDKQNKIDKAHIPLLLFDKYHINVKNANIISYVRNPYHRIISAYIYRNNNKVEKNFKNFVKNKLNMFEFNKNFNYNIIHYYPQYLFLINKDDNIENIEIKKVEELENHKKYNLNLYLDKEVIDIINRIYLKDFEFFKYKMLK